LGIAVAACHKQQRRRGNGQQNSHDHPEPPLRKKLAFADNEEMRFPENSSKI
jgi:hypothetical protein